MSNILKIKATPNRPVWPNYNMTKPSRPREVWTEAETLRLKEFAAKWAQIRPDLAQKDSAQASGSLKNRPAGFFAAAAEYVASKMADQCKAKLQKIEIAGKKMIQKPPNPNRSANKSKGSCLLKPIARPGVSSANKIDSRGGQVVKNQTSIDKSSDFGLDAEAYAEISAEDLSLGSPVTHIGLSARFSRAGDLKRAKVSAFLDQTDGFVTFETSLRDSFFPQPFEAFASPEDPQAVEPEVKRLSDHADFAEKLLVHCRKKELFEPLSRSEVEHLSVTFKKIAEHVSAVEAILVGLAGMARTRN